MCKTQMQQVETRQVLLVEAGDAVPPALDPWAPPAEETSAPPLPPPPPQREPPIPSRALAAALVSATHEGLQELRRGNARRLSDPDSTIVCHAPRPGALALQACTLTAQ